MDTLTAKQAAQKWELLTYQVKRICKNMGINPGAIPADLKPVYMVLIMLLESAGICEAEWRDKMYDSLME